MAYPQLNEIVFLYYVFYFNICLKEAFEGSNINNENKFHYNIIRFLDNLYNIYIEFF